MSLPVQDAEKSSKWSSSDPWSNPKHTPGAYPSSPNPRIEQHLADHSSIANAVKARRHEYIRKQQVKIKIGSWNTASVSGAEKDLAGWFVKGFGVKGIVNDLSELSVDDADSVSSSSSDDVVESVEDQEQRFKKHKGTLPKNDEAAVASEENVGIYALGLQEVIDITSVTEAIRPYYDPNPGKKWKHALKKALPAGYKKVAELQLLGLLILIYAAPDVAPFISSVDSVSVGTGALGYMGNKGATSVRIMLGATTRILFVNSHLAAGADKAALDRRIWDTNQILLRTKFAPANYDGDMLEDVQEQIGDEDFAFWFGDLNYRLDGIPGEDVRRLLLLHTRNEYDILNKSRRKIDSELGFIDAPETDLQTNTVGRYEYGAAERSAKESSIEPPLDPKDDPASLYTTLQALLAHDQLRTQQKLGKAFHEGWREGEIGFLPTYKYDVGSVGMFDSGEKKRSPSWCDRILYRTRRDKQAYDDRIKMENDVRQRDADLKARGVETDAADQEILFDYDPETDGAGDYDEYDEDDDDAADIQSVKTVEGAEDTIKLEDYVSHQRVLSSDHKPLSAVFTITYDAVVHEIKNKIHAEVTRDFDKTENESRPSITVVVENPPGSTAHADKPTGSTELSDVVFGLVRYGVPQTRIVTIANTSPIDTVFAFIDRPSEADKKERPAPAWLSIHVNHDSYPIVGGKEDLGDSTPFLLEPGDVTTVELTLMISDHHLVRHLNEQSTILDDILVLRVLHGRDHFVRLKGTFLPTCFGRSLNELVQASNGVRNIDANAQLSDISPTSPSNGSMPKELLTLGDPLPGLVERAIADWSMLHAADDAPWYLNASWPFMEYPVHINPRDDHSKALAEVREALDTATPLEDVFDQTIQPLERIELLAETLLDFLASLKEGIIPASAWTSIEQRIIELEKQKTITTLSESTSLQEIVIDALSMTPVHSVTFTFITFMLTRIISELSAETSDLSKSPPLPQGLQSSSPPPPSSSVFYTRDRSSTQVSEQSTSDAISIDSITTTASTTTNTSSTTPIVPTTKSRLSFLPSFPRRRSGIGLGIGSSGNTGTHTNNVAEVMLINRRTKLIEAYASQLAPLLIRAPQDETVKGKEKKLLDARKRKVLETFLAHGS